MITLSNPPSKNHPTLAAHQTANSHQGFEKARKQLESLSDKRLLSDLENLNHKERRLKVLVLLYLSELETRKLYLPLGFSSLFDFCTYRLGYTRATAVRRIRSARVAARYPEALVMLVTGEINITTLSMISDILDQDNHEKILSEIRGKSTREVELLVSRHRSMRVSRDTVRPICLMKRVDESAAAYRAGSSTETKILDQDLTGADGRCKSNKLNSSAETKILDQDLAGADGHCKSNKLSSSAETNIMLTF